ncbi:MAG: hypothetical protein HY040_05790 [Planctomycetes bacterium]|nr:hypothetical protein [Planctomycetota bacterium]
MLTKNVRPHDAIPLGGLTPKISAAVWELFQKAWRLSSQQLHTAQALCRAGKVTLIHKQLALKFGAGKVKFGTGKKHVSRLYKHCNIHSRAALIGLVMEADARFSRQKRRKKRAKPRRKPKKRA